MGNAKLPNNLCRQLQLFLDSDGVLCCGGRLELSTLPYATKFPILMPHDSAFVTLLIQYSHDAVKHAGIKSTLLHLRNSYWLLQGRKAVRRFVNSCLVCRRFVSKPYAVPPSPPLPLGRSTFDRVFKMCGLDFAGPFHVRESKEGASYKVYLLLLTCGSVRAVHFELVSSMSIDSFMNAFKRFCNRRCIPELILSDNFTTFKRAQSEVNAWLESDRLEHFCSLNGIKWQFIVERAP